MSGPLAAGQGSPHAVGFGPLGTRAGVDDAPRVIRRPPRDVRGGVAPRPRPRKARGSGSARLPFRQSPTMTGSSTCDGRVASKWSVFSAMRTGPGRPSGPPLLGFTSMRGKLEEEMSTRMR